MGHNSLRNIGLWIACAAMVAGSLVGLQRLSRKMQLNQSKLTYQITDNRGNSIASIFDAPGNSKLPKEIFSRQIEVAKQAPTGKGCLNSLAKSILTPTEVYAQGTCGSTTCSGHWLATCTQTGVRDCPNLTTCCGGQWYEKGCKNNSQPCSNGGTLCGQTTCQNQ